MLILNDSAPLRLHAREFRPISRSLHLHAWRLVTLAIQHGQPVTRRNIVAG
jgi:hypothetical protein